MIRPILSLKRLLMDKAEGKVCYPKGKHRSESEQMDNLEAESHLIFLKAFVTENEGVISHSFNNDTEIRFCCFS